MDMIYTIGPSVIAAITVLIIAVYTYTVPSASIVTVVWGVLAIAMGQYSFFAGVSECKHQTGLAFCFLGHSRLRRPDCCWWLWGVCHP